MRAGSSCLFLRLNLAVAIGCRFSGRQGGGCRLGCRFTFPRVPSKKNLTSVQNYFFPGKVEVLPDAKRRSLEVNIVPYGLQLPISPVLISPSLLAYLQLCRILINLVVDSVVGYGK